MTSRMEQNHLMEQRPDPKPKMVVICGPTGTGKTAFAIELAKSIRGEIIGADSMQIYRFMDIGTAKPTPQEQSAVRHHMIDIIDPDEPFDAAAYAVAAKIVTEKLLQNGELPFVVGGTGLYIRSLIYGLFEAGPYDENIRERLKRDAERDGSARLHARLESIDPVAASKIHKNDTLRIVRALEVFEVTGKPISTHHLEHGFRKKLFSTLKIGLLRDRETLYQRINNRVDQMIEEGLLSEVKGLLAKGYSPDLKSMQSLGYRHMINFISGRVSWETAVSTLKRDHRRYAKRQLSWFNADDEVRWLSPDRIEEAVDMVSASSNFR